MISPTRITWTTEEEIVLHNRMESKRGRIPKAAYLKELVRKDTEEVNEKDLEKTT